MNVDALDVALRVVQTSTVQPGQTYCHFKGGLYVVLDVGVAEATFEPIVAYTARDQIAAEKPHVWFRALAIFTELVEYEGTRVPRFALVDTPIDAAECAAVLQRLMNGFCARGAQPLNLAGLTLGAGLQLLRAMGVEHARVLELVTRLWHAEEN